MTAAQVSTLLSVLALIVSIIVVISMIYQSRLAARDSRRVASMDLLQLLESTRPDRYVLRTAALPTRPDNPASIAWDEVPSDVVDSFERVARAFDIVGTLDRLQLVSARFVDSFYSATCHQLWTTSALGSYVTWRREHDPYLFWELDAYYHRIRRVWDNHPAHSGTTRWPRNPRRPKLSNAATRFQQHLTALRPSPSPSPTATPPNG